MGIDKEKRLELGNYIKILLLKYRIRQAGIADLCGVSRQYMNQICSGRNPLSAEQYEKVYARFAAAGASDAELRQFARLHIAAKLNIDMMAASTCSNPIAVRIVENFAVMDDASLMKLLRRQEQLLLRDKKSDPDLSL